MRVSSIISEYNPFHEGHKYHMENTKKITNSDYTIVIMSGDFTQRGTPAIIDKYARTKQALLNGADLVLELPVAFATSSAEGFACGAVSILNKLGIVDHLVFGSEAGNIDSINDVAEFLSHETPVFTERLQNYLKQGFPFPKARALVLKEQFPNLDENFLSSSNNILGIEYCKALKIFSSHIKPITITRKDNLYNDEHLSDNGKLSSATSIRNVLHTCSNFDELTSHMPENSLTIIKENWNTSTPIATNDFSLLLKYKLLLENKDSLVQYLDVTSDLADRIYNNLNQFTDYESFCNLLKTKELTFSRISRCLLHILLDIKKSEYENIKNNEYGQYARILGFRKEASSLLHEIKKHSSIPLISKLSDSLKELDDTSISLLEKDIQASHIYESVVANKFSKDFKNEFQRKLVIL